MLDDNTVSQLWLEICINADPFHKGVSVYVGVTGKVLCPVSAILNYSVWRGFQLDSCNLVWQMPR